MKIAVTICDFAGCIHVGADAERSTEMLEVPDELIPKNLKRLLEHRKDFIAGKCGVPDATVSFSLFEE